MTEQREMRNDKDIENIEREEEETEKEEVEGKMEEEKQ